MKQPIRFCLIMMVVCLTACAGEKGSNAISDNSAGVLSEAPKKTAAKYLAYVHNLEVELESKALVDAHNQLIAACQKDAEYSCLVLDVSLRTGDRSQSKIQLRVKSEGLHHFSNIVSKEGRVLSNSTSAVDLADRIVDNLKRIEMLESYRAKLIALEARPNADLDSLMKIASELATVQSDLEFAQGRKSKLLTRVERDVLNIKMTTPYSASISNPIVDSVVSFTDELSYGVASVISASAFIFPWLIFLLLLFVFIRWIFRRMRGK